ncbi:MAG: DNA-binding protein [Eubacterium sp.]|nr:DNA-binding protein [Eubacterium sp.]
MERIVQQTMLYDFYGELLTPHQRQAYEAVVMEDLSYSELARNENISRQGAYDMIRRCDKQLEEYEKKLHMVERFLSMKKELQELKESAEELKNQLDESGKEPGMLRLTDDILKKADELISRL